MNTPSLAETIRSGSCCEVRCGADHFRDTTPYELFVDHRSFDGIIYTP